jgi:hypothetical protein
MGDKKADADARSLSSGSEIPKSQSDESYVSGTQRHSGSMKSLPARHEPFDKRQASLVRRTLYELVESDFFNYFILAIIMLNALILGLQTSQEMVKAFGVYFERAHFSCPESLYLLLTEPKFRILFPAH